MSVWWRWFAVRLAWFVLILALLLAMTALLIFRGNMQQPLL